jgi:D-sedoheptulose 7-phosphate isomerase
VSRFRRRVAPRDEPATRPVTPPGGAALPLPAGHDHLDSLALALSALYAAADRLDAWGCHLAEVLGGGGRLLVAGNGGSAAQAQHLTAELVGRYRDERPPFSAIALCAESSAVTAVGNDYGFDEVFARQVRAHGRAGDVLLTLSTSGRSGNVLAAVEAAEVCGLTTWALTGPPGNPLAAGCDDALCVDSPHTATVQEIHLVAVHLVCAAFDHAIERLALGALG